MSGEQEAAEPLGYRPEQPPKDRPLRIGARVVCIKGDKFISEGDTGLVFSVTPSQPWAPPRATVLWDTECKSMIDATDIGIILEDGMRLCVEARDIQVGDTIHGRIGTVTGIVTDDDETEVSLSGGTRFSVAPQSHVWVERATYVPQPTTMGTFG